MTDSNKDWAEALKSGQSIADVVAAGAAFAAQAQKAAAPTKKLAAKPAKSAMPTMHTGRGQRYGNLTWFPIFTDAPVVARNYVTQVANGSVVVDEQAQPNVGFLSLNNQGNQTVVLFEGALLEGGWQHRALTHTVMVPAATAIEIPVVCVEAGRWNGVSTQRFGSKVAPARVRSGIRGMRKDETGKVFQAQADQGQVWSEVRNFANATNKARPTESLVEMYDEIEADIKARNLEAPLHLYGQRGVLVAVNGAPLALEVFDHPDTLAERFEAILDSYLPESFMHPYRACKSQMARDFVTRVETVGVSNTESTDRLRSKPDSVVATEAVLNVDGALLHLATLNAKHSMVMAG